jgi:hypothetical protein
MGSQQLFCFGDDETAVFTKACTVQSKINFVRIAQSLPNASNRFIWDGFLERKYVLTVKKIEFGEPAEFAVDFFTAWNPPFAQVLSTFRFLWF